MTQTAQPLSPPAKRSDKDTLAGNWPTFAQTLAVHGKALQRLALTTLQINVGKLCNQTCRHCHVEAGPRRKEIMTAETAARIVTLMDGEGGEGLETVDLTGGAPELNPQFHFLATAARARGFRTIDRCNLTVLLQPGQEETARFLADQQIEVVASMPCYSRKNVEQQRGDGVFDQSILALQLLNELGYGQEASGLVLNLVYNPVGPFLPPDQGELEADYHERLCEDFGIRFNQLFTITNMPIKRFLYDLKHQGELEDYMTTLVNSFNLSNLDNLMCKDLVSIGWDGQIYDCDFNQMLEIAVGNRAQTIWDISSLAALAQGEIATADHCYGCTAGAGSSCGGQLN
jgi:radical SAM/Cys-rich protein